MQRMFVSTRETIACYGDSLTFGDNAAPRGAKAWPYLLGDSFSPHVAIANLGIGGDTSTQIAARFAAYPGLFGKPTIIWAGRNNYATPATVKADISSMVSALKTDRYIVASVINAHRTNELKGQANYNTIVALNADLQAAYGSHYFDIRSGLVMAYNPSLPQDVQDFADDVPPTSLVDDGLHFNNAGSVVVKDLFGAKIVSLGWF